MATPAYTQDTIIKAVYDPVNAAFQVNIVAGSLSATIDSVNIGGVDTGVVLPVKVEDADGHEMAIDTNGAVDVNMVSGSVSVDWVKIRDDDLHELAINTDGSLNVSGLSGDSNISGIDSGVVLPVAVEDADGHTLQINTDGSINVSGLSGDTNISGIDSGVTIPVSIADAVTIAEPVTVDGTVAVSGVGGTTTVDGTVNVGNTPDVNISGIDSGVTLPVSIAGSVTVAEPVTVDGTVAVSSVGGTVTVDGSGSTQPVSGTVSVDSLVSSRTPVAAGLAAKVSIVGGVSDPNNVFNTAGNTVLIGLSIFNLGPDTAYLNFGSNCDEDDFPILPYMEVFWPTTSSITGYAETGDTADLRVVWI